MKKLLLNVGQLSVASFPTAPTDSTAAVAEPCLFTPSCQRTGAGSCWCPDNDTFDCP